MRLQNGRWYWVADAPDDGIVATGAAKRAKLWRTHFEADTFAKNLPSTINLESGRKSVDSVSKQTIVDDTVPCRITGIDVIYKIRRSAP